ncbi:MAG: hypothetical protein FWD77_01640 [Betaproteobacteria bacterium]|nr:hypothetical protein [Betaproteobacteria bacterium]
MSKKTQIVAAADIPEASRKRERFLDRKFKSRVLLLNGAQFLVERGQIVTDDPALIAWLLARPNDFERIGAE